MKETNIPQKFSVIICSCVWFHCILKTEATYLWRDNTPKPFSHPSMFSEESDENNFEENDDCNGGTCTKEDECPSALSGRATGSCAKQWPGRWVCCQNRIYEDISNPGWGFEAEHVTTKRPKEPSKPVHFNIDDDFNDWDPVSFTESANLGRESRGFSGNVNVDCDVGQCVRREDCSRDRSTALPATSFCRRRLPVGTWVCCTPGIDRGAAARTVAYISSELRATTVQPRVVHSTVEDVNRTGMVSRIGISALRPQSSPYMDYHHYEGSSHWNNPGGHYPSAAANPYPYPDYPDYDAGIPLPSSNTNHWGNNPPVPVFPYGTGRDSSRTSTEGSNWKFPDETSEDNYRQPDDITRGCNPGQCVKRKDCSSWNSIITEATGPCKRRIGGDWICCRSKYDDTYTTERSSTRRHYTTPSTTPASEDNYRQPVDMTRGCSPGKCVKRKDCASWDSVITEATGPCKRRLGGDWVCCRSKYDDTYTTERSPTRRYYTTPSTTRGYKRTTTPSYLRVTARTTTVNYGGMRYTTAVPSRKPSTRNLPKRDEGGRYTTTSGLIRTTKKVNLGGSWGMATTPSPIEVDPLSFEKPKKDGCIAGNCTRRQDCTGPNAAILHPTGLCNKRTDGQWVCCLRNETKSTPTKKTTSSGRYTTASLLGNDHRDPVRVTNRRDTYATTEAPRNQPRFECGIRGGRTGNRRPKRNYEPDVDSDSIVFRSHRISSRSPSIIGRIVGGKEAEPYSWPWVVALFKENSPGMKRFLCSGSLINDKYILTAAHVFTGQDVRNASSFVVTLGTHTGSESIAEYRVRSIKQHPDYSNRYHYNDIALLELDNRVIYSEYITPICLPSNDKYYEDSDLVGRNVTVTGWGDEEFGGKSSEVLKEATFPVLSRRTCNSSYVHVAANKFPRGITKDMICAGSPKGGQDACQGDSGGPLTINEGSRWIQVGIVSFGHQCGDPKYPGVYTKVAHFLDWINRSIRKHG